MEEIKLTIISDEEKEDQVNYDLNKSVENKNIIDDEVIKEEYNDWIKNLIIFMNSCNYRKVLKEIEKRKNLFKTLDIYDLWKYKIIQLKAILKIIRIKLKKYKTEIKKENSLRVSSIKFWFNLIHDILENLITELISDKENEKIDMNSKNILKPIQYIIEIYLELIILLIQFYYLRTEGVSQILAYLSIFNLFIPYIPLITDMKSLYFIQILLLLKAKLYLQNKNYLLSIEQQNTVIKLCLRAFLFEDNVDKQVNHMSARNHFSSKIYNNFVNYILAFYFRGITFEHLGEIQNANQAYIQTKLIYMKYLIEENEKFGIFLNKIENETRISLVIINDIKNIIKKREEDEKKKLLKKKMRNHFILFRNGYRNSQIDEKREKNINDKNNHSLINYNGQYRKIIKPNNIRRGIKDKGRVEKLEKYLNNIGNHLYIEEENMNNNLINKYTKTKYILSTISMIDNLMSKDFQKILMKMDTIEITKPKEEIKNMIDRTITTKRAKLFNLKLKNKKRNNSALNMYRGHMSNDNKENAGYKTSKTKDSIIINKNKKKLFLIRNINKSQMYDNNSTTLFKQQNKKQQNKLLLSQRMTEINSSQYRKLKDNSVKNNLSIRQVNYRLKSAIVKSKTNKRCLSSYGQIIKYPIDKESFSKSQLRKKRYLDKYLDKEFAFQKRLLNSKRNEVKDISEIEFFNQRNAYDSAERDFDMIFNIQKSKYSTKYISNLITMKQIKINNEKIQKKEERNDMNDLTNVQIQQYMVDAKENKKKRRKGITEMSLKKIIDRKNEDDMKKLSVECADLSFERKKIEIKKRNLILNAYKSKSQTKFY